MLMLLVRICADENLRKSHLDVDKQNPEVGGNYERARA